MLKCFAEERYALSFAGCEMVGEAKGGKEGEKKEEKERDRER